MIVKKGLGESLVMKMWRYYLIGKIFGLRTDHSGLKYLFGQPTLNARQSRWLEFLNEYDFDIRNIKGKEKKVVDALNKRVHEMNLQPLSCTNHISKTNFRGCKIISTVHGNKGKNSARQTATKN
jgi:hypothetical protein